MAPSIDYVQPLSSADGPLFEEIRAVLHRYDATHRFGICLLHGHPQVGQEDDDILVECSDVNNQQLITRPYKRSNAGPAMVETAWRFDENGHKVAVAGCQTTLSGGHV